MPNSYSLRICSNSSTFVLQSTKFLRSGLRPFQSTRSFQRVGQNKLPKWANSKYRNHMRLIIKKSLNPTSKESGGGQSNRFFGILILLIWVLLGFCKFANAATADSNCTLALDITPAASIAITSGITDSGFIASEENRHLRIKLLIRLNSGSKASLWLHSTALPVIDQTTQAALASKDVKPNLAEPNDPQAKLIFVVERSGSYAINVDLAATDFGTPSNDIALELQSSDGSLRNRLALPSDGRAVRSGANP